MPQAYAAFLMLVLVGATIRLSTPLYRRPIWWLIPMLISVILGTIEYVGLVFARGELYGLPQFIAAIPFLVSTILLLYVGYRFKRTSLI